MLLIWLTGATTVRDANGLIAPELLSHLNFTSNSLIGSDLITTTIQTIFKNDQFGVYSSPDCLVDFTCEYGLQNYFQVFSLTI